VSAHLATRRLSAYLDDELDGHDSRLVEDHVNGCPRCERRLRGLRGVVVELKRLPQASPPPFLERAIERELQARRSAREQRARSLGRNGLRGLQGLIRLSSAMAVAVAMVAVLITDSVSRQRSAEPGEARPVPAAGAERATAGGRHFVLDRGVWRQEGLLAASDAAPTQGPRVSADAALARAPWLAELLRRGPVVLELDGAVVRVEPGTRADGADQRAGSTAITR
jgi:hypothetical protein